MNKLIFILILIFISFGWKNMDWVVRDNAAISMGQGNNCDVPALMSCSESQLIADDNVSLLREETNGFYDCTISLVRNTTAKLTFSKSTVFSIAGSNLKHYEFILNDSLVISDSILLSELRSSGSNITLFPGTYPLEKGLFNFHMYIPCSR